ncbi:MAG: FMN-binding protein [Prevotella sp.]|nr:FMN-binding protein [Prevotella sp.]
MKKKNSILKSLAAIVFFALMTSAVTSDEVITTEGSATVINTTSLTQDVIGYQSPTPVKIYIEGNKITKISPLRNKETPKYFQQAKKILCKYEGKTVNKAAKMKVDGVTGATMSSEALMKNVKTGLEYYNKQKK